MTANMKFAGFSLVCLWLLGSACVPAANLYQGNPVASDHVMPLQSGGPHGGDFENFDLVMTYQFTRDGDVFEISGRAELGQHYQMVYDKINDLRIYLFFVDADSRVLQTVLLTSAATGMTAQQLRFSRFFKVPRGATGFSFGYDGKVSELDSSKVFYRLPLRR